MSERSKWNNVPNLNTTFKVEGGDPRVKLDEGGDWLDLPENREILTALQAGDSETVTALIRQQHRRTH